MAKSQGQSPAALARARLAESGIAQREASRLRLRALAPAAVRGLSPSFSARPALHIPYFTLAGKVNGFYRIRYLGEALGFDAPEGRRYAQAPGTDAEAYLPPLAAWRAIAADPSRAVLITEGELKAACATMAGLPTIGLGGVWSWKSTRRGFALLPMLADFRWEGRRAYVVFDSDFATNPDVMRALTALAKELTARGASPSVVTLPALPELAEEGKKTGLDDFVVAKGRAALEALLEAAEPFGLSEELWKLNGEVVYIKDPGLVVALADGRKVSAAAFTQHAYSNRHYQETQFTAKGEPRLVQKPLAPAWLQWERRAELARITYRPGEPAVTRAGEYNYWRGWGAEPRRGSVALWSRLLDYMFGKDAAARRWFEQWCAWPFQHPGAKVFSAAVLWGVRQGTGKSLIGYSLGACYGRNFKEIGEDDLSGPFNEWAENKQFVLADDVTGTEYRKAEAERLKFMITRKTLTVNAKYMPTYEVPDCVNYLFTANHPDSFVVEDEDRRYFVWETPRLPMAKAFYDEYDAWLNVRGGERAEMGGPAGAALLWHFQNAVDCAGFGPRAHALETAAKRAMIMDGKSDVGEWVARLREDPDSVLVRGGVGVSADLLTNTQLLSFYDPENRKRVTANGLGRELKRGGFGQANGGAVVKTSRGPQRLYAVRNADRWAKARPAALAEHWDGHFARAAEGGAGSKLSGGR